MNVHQGIAAAWQSYVNGNREDAIIKLSHIGGINFDDQRQKEILAIVKSGHIGDSDFDAPRRKEILSITNYLEGYEHPALTNISGKKSLEFALAIVQYWLFSTCNVENLYHLCNAGPLIAILGTGYHLDIDMQKMESELSGRYTGKARYGYYTSNSTGAPWATPPIADHEHLGLWPEITILPELAWFSRAMFVRIIQNVQAKSGLASAVWVNTTNDSRFNSALQELAYAKLIKINLSAQERLANLSIQKLKQLARDFRIRLGTASKENGKEYICERIAGVIDEAELETILDQHNIIGEQIRPLLSNLKLFEQYVCAEIYRISLYTNWLVDVVRKRKRGKATHIKFTIPNIFERVDDLFPSLYEGQSSAQDRNSVPYFKRYNSTPAMMDESQRSFFDFLVNEIEHERYPSVEGNISYLFAYIYPAIQRWNEKGYEYVHDKLLVLVEAYYQEKSFVSHCKEWAYDCLLALEQYDKYLELTAPENILPSQIGHSNDRCNVFYHIGRPTNYRDILGLFVWSNRVTLTSYTQENIFLFSEILDEVFVEETQIHGPWLERLLSAQEQPRKNYKTLFSGVLLMGNKPILSFPFYDFRAGFSSEYWHFVDVIAALIRKAENRLREQHDLPKIGEGWISETQLYNAVKEAFPQTEVIHHGHTNWLGRQHLDIWLPQWRIAVEYQGLQHFQPVDFFGGITAFEAIRERDVRKKKLCQDNGVMLIVATPDYTHVEIIEQIKQSRR